jgi:C4-dicarboxylate-binding protein DctP
MPSLDVQAMSVLRAIVLGRSLCSLLASLWLCLLSALPPAFGETTVLRLNLPISADSPVGENVRGFALQAHAQTGGAIRIELLDKAQRFEEHEVIVAVAKGAIEMGATPLNQFAQDVPLAAAFLQPFLFDFDALAQAATEPRSEIRGLIDSEILRRTKTRVLWVQPYGSSVILSKTAPTTHPKAIANLGVATPDDQVRRLMRTCGGVPFILSPADLFAELQMGRVVAAATDIMNVRERNLWRVADTITNLRFAPSLFMVVINDTAWQRLTSEHRNVLSELAEEAQNLMWARFSRIRADAYAFAVQNGMRVVELAGADIEAWRACSAPLLLAYMEHAGDVGPKLFAAYGKLRTQPCCREAPPDTLLNRQQ